MGEGGTSSPETTEPPVAAAPAKPLFHRDRAEYFAFIAQMVSAVAVVVSLIFVGVQLREANVVAIRDESNATMTQWSAFRTSIYEGRDAAEVFAAGMSGSRALDEADQLRFLYIMREHGWATFQVWDRTQKGLFPKWNFDVGAANDFLKVICTPGGAQAWASIKGELPPPYVADMDRLAIPFASANGVACDAPPFVDQAPVPTPQPEAAAEPAGG